MLVLKRKDEDTAVGDLIGPRVTVGRDPSNDIVLDDASVSGYHATLYIEDEVCTLADLGSTNGSFVNGQRVTGRTRFAEGDHLGIGTVSLDVVDKARRIKATVVMPAVQIESSQTGRPGATLRLVSDSRRSVFLAQGTVLQIGRGSENGLVIDSDMVSTRHASIVLNSTGAEVRDHGSTNGTYVNGERVVQQNLRHGDRIRFDTEEYLFDMPLSAPAATRVNPAVQVHIANTHSSAPSSAESVLSKVDLLAKELGVVGLATPSAPTVVQPAFVPPSASRQTSIAPVDQAADEELDEPAFMRDDTPHTTNALADDGVVTLFRLVLGDFGAWIAAIAMMLGVTLLQVIGMHYGLVATPGKLADKSAQMASLFFGLAYLPAYAVALSTGAKALGYDIQSPTTYGLIRAFPLLGAVLVFYLIVFGPPFVLLAIGGVLGGVAAGGLPLIVLIAALLMLLVSLYVCGRLWPMLVMAITDRDATAVRAAWQLTGQPGAWTRATFPLLGWLIVVLLVGGGIAVVSFNAGIAGLIVAAALSSTLLLPLFCLLVISRFMRLNTLRPG